MQSCDWNNPKLNTTDEYTHATLGVRGCIDKNLRKKNPKIKI
jgi:hypothetical protein